MDVDDVIERVVTDENRRLVSAGPSDKMEDNVAATNEAEDLMNVEDLIARVVTAENERYVHTLEATDMLKHGEERPNRAKGGCEDDSDFSFSDEADDENDSDEDYDDDHMPFKGRRRPEKSSKGGKGKRGRGRHAKASKQREDLFNTSTYKRKKNDPSNLCPQPPPKKMRGGRRTMMKEALPKNDLQEANVQLASLGLRGKEITINANPCMRMVPFTGTTFAPLLRTLFICKENEENLSSMSTNVVSLTGPNPNVIVKFLKEVKSDEPADLYKILEAEHLKYIIERTTSQVPIDCTTWLKHLAVEFLSNPRFKRFEFHEKFGRGGGNEKDEAMWDSKFIYHHTLAYLLRYVKSMVVMNLQKLVMDAAEMANAMMSGRARLNEIKKEKFALQEKYKKVHYELSNRNSKMDEMSITGVRQVKIMMDCPYFKTEDGIMSFQLPTTGLNRKNLLLNSQKQKWTAKDLQALKQVIKESVVSQKEQELNGRYLELLKESDKRRFEEMAQEGRPLGSISQPPQKRRRGRPTKEETSQRDKYGIVYPVICRSSTVVIAYSILPKQLSEWRTGMEKRLRTMSFDALLKEKNAEKFIDWSDVALKLMIRTKKLRLEEDCRLTYKHEVDPKVNSKRLTVEQTKKIKQLRDVTGLDWDAIADEINRPLKEKNPDTPLHTPYQCFAKYVTRISPPPKPEWTEEMDETIRTGLAEYPSHWRKVAAMVNNEAVTKKVVMERYKKAISPMIKVGPFSRVEDCLLLLTIRRLRDFIIDEGHFGSVLAYLPWRYETTWRDRAHNLFNDWIVPWTLEEDRLLLELAGKMKRNWQKISERFSSFKNRKGCLTRYKILTRNLEKDNNSTLEQYHDAYAMTRYNVFQYKHLNEAITLLKKIRDQKIQLADAPQFVLRSNRDTPPSDEELMCLIICYDRTVLQNTIASLEVYINSRDAYWKNWMKQNGDKKRTFDRRTFHPENPKSVASAIHIRGLKLKPKSGFNNLNDFEVEIYVHYVRFSRTKSLKKNTKRPYLPPASFFRKWSSVQRIIVDEPSGTEDDEEEPCCSKKWTRIMKKREQKKTKKFEQEDEYYDVITESETETDEDVETAAETSGSESD